MGESLQLYDFTKWLWSTHHCFILKIEDSEYRMNQLNQYRVVLAGFTVKIIKSFFFFQFHVLLSSLSQSRR